MSIKIGVVGLGHLGKIHLKCLDATDFEVYGCYDLDANLMRSIAEQHGIIAFDTLDELIAQCDVVDVVSSTNSHFTIAHKALEQGKHVFIEKPFVRTSAEGVVLENLAIANKCKVQLGHVERYNPAIKAIKDIGLDPMFIEAHRLSSFNPRGNDVSVIMDLMIHDLDLLCHLIDSPIDSVDANGVSVVERSPDICNARLKFKNGAVANLTASRISMKQMRKFRIFQNNKYLSLDLLKKEAQIFTLSDTEQENAMSFESQNGKKFLTIDNPSLDENNAIQEELSDFYLSIVEGKPISVSLKDGLQSLKMAEMIQDSIFVNQEKIS